MLDEAVGIIRALWTGTTVDHRGEFYEVENARLFDPPTPAPPIIVSGFGAEAIDLAARIGDGFWGHAPDAEVLARYRGRYAGERFVQLSVAAPWITAVAGRHHAVVGGFALADAGRRLVVVAVIDNLLKGAATQAMQNLNLAFGLDESAGLVAP